MTIKHFRILTSLDGLKSGLEPSEDNGERYEIYKELRRLGGKMPIHPDDFNMETETSVHERRYRYKRSVMAIIHEYEEH